MHCVSHILSVLATATGLGSFLLLCTALVLRRHYRHLPSRNLRFEISSAPGGGFLVARSDGSYRLEGRRLGSALQD